MSFAKLHYFRRNVVNNTEFSSSDTFFLNQFNLTIFFDYSSNDYLDLLYF